MEQDTILSLIIISLILSGLSIAQIIRKAFMAFLPFIHITCMVGSLIILALTILDLLVTLKMLDLSRDSSSIYFLSASLTSILSSYILLQVGFNFYQDYNFIKTLLMFAPIVVSMGVFGLSVFLAIRMILNVTNILTKEEQKLVIITFILNAILSALSLLYGIIPLFTIRSQTRLRPQQTAVSIVHFSIVVTLFIAHFVVYTIITFSGPISDMGDNAIQNMLLILIFPGCLFSPPRSIVKFIKRRVLGVEELAIGGDYRPNMLPNDYTNRRSLSNLQFTPFNDTSDNNSSNNSLSSSQTPMSTLSVVTISSPTPLLRSSPTPNSASPKRNELPIVRTKSQPLSYLRDNPNPPRPIFRRNTFSTMNSTDTDSDTSLYISKFASINNSPEDTRLTQLSRSRLKEYLVGEGEDEDEGEDDVVIYDRY